MGIVGLLPFLQPASRKCNINEFKGCTVAIDTYCWLHKGVFACAEKLVQKQDTDLHIKYCLKYVHFFLSHNIKPIMVFDGQHLLAKKETEQKRRDQRKAAHARGTEFLRLGKYEEARQCFRQCVNINHEMALALIKECRSKNVDCIVAPYEADAQLAYLNMQGIAQIVITEDSDLVLFGCTKILFKFSLDGSGTLIERDKLNLAMKMRPDQYTFDKFRYMCILSGCDYVSSLPGIGLKKAHKAVVLTHDPNIYKLLPRLPQYLNMGKLTVSKEYIENFKLADATLRHQVVFDPRKRALVRLTDPESSGISPEYLKNAGEIHDEGLQMALGNIDPISLKVMDNWSPDDTPLGFNSIWSNSYTKLSPQRTPNRPSISAKSTKNQVVTVSSASILAMREQQLVEYDNKLMEELKVYNMTPLPKRQKIVATDQDDDINMQIDPELQLQKNPFIKNKQVKSFSKFEPTKLQSPFFACTSKSDGNKNKYSEGKNEDDIECNSEDLLVDECKSISLAKPCDYPNSQCINDISSDVDKKSFSETQFKGDRDSSSNIHDLNFLQKYKINKSEKKIKSAHQLLCLDKVKSDTNIPLEESKIEDNTESDVENLTPSQSRVEVSQGSEFSMVVNSKDTFLRRTANTAAGKEKYKRCNSGLSQKKKKDAMQPSILSMFNKMTSKNC